MNIQKIIDNVDTNWDKNLIVRYLICKTAIYFQRDTSFFFANMDTQIKRMNNTKIHDGLIFCKSICIFYQNLFKQFDIETKIIITNNKRPPHHILLVHTNFWYSIDPLKDLMNHQAQLPSQYYCIPIQTNSQKILETYSYIKTLNTIKLKEMDEFLNLDLYSLSETFKKYHQILTTNKAVYYLSKYFQEEINPKDYNKIIIKKIDFINEQCINCVNIPGPIERVQYFSYLCNVVFNHAERKHIEFKLYPNLKFKIRIFFQDNETFFLEQKTAEKKYVLKRIY